MGRTCKNCTSELPENLVTNFCPYCGVAIAPDWSTEFEKNVRTRALREFLPLRNYERCLIPPAIPPKILHRATTLCYREVPPEPVLAIFDCSPNQNGKTGILVSVEAFYLFNSKTTKRYPLCENNEIHVPWSYLRVFAAYVGALLLILIVFLVSPELIFLAMAMILPICYYDVSRGGAGEEGLWSESTPRQNQPLNLTFTTDCGSFAAL